MIDILTDEQKKRISQIRDKYLDRYFSLESDDKAIHRYVRWLYKKLGYEKPLVFIFDSPFSCQIAANLLKQNNNRQISEQIWGQISEQIREQISGQIWRQNLEYFNFNYFGDTSDYCWLAFYEFYSTISEVKGDFSKIKEYSELLLEANLFMMIAFEKIVFISRPPISILRDEKHRLHCIEKSAIAYKDSFELFYVHGVYFEKELFEKIFIHKTMTGKDIMRIGNAEQRSAIIQALGYQSIINDLTHVEILDTYVINKNNITYEYKVFEFELDGNVIRVVEVQDHTTRKKTFLGVPRDEKTKTCMGAIAWTFDMSEDEYILDVET